MNRQKTIERFKQIYAEYAWTLKSEKALTGKDEVIGDLLGIVLFMDEQSKNIITLADAAVEEAREVEAAVLAVEEGRELLAYLKHRHPNLFPTKLKRGFYGNA